VIEGRIVITGTVINKKEGPDDNTIVIVGCVWIDGELAGEQGYKNFVCVAPLD
jgi:hypothetical protein